MLLEAYLRGADTAYGNLTKEAGLGSLIKKHPGVTAALAGMGGAGAGLGAGLALGKSNNPRIRRIMRIRRYIVRRRSPESGGRDVETHPGPGGW